MLDLFSIWLVLASDWADKDNKEMPKQPEKPVRVSEMTHHRIGYLAGCLAMTQGAVVEMVFDKAIQDAKMELDELTQAMLNGNHDQILDARNALMAKMNPAGDA
jgi:hypothetical protein